MGICIFCNKENQAKSIEHIVSESFGNKQYIVERGRVCDDCNSRFSKFEGEALSNTVFVMERARFGIETKKGKNVKGKVAGLTITGNEDFEKNRITVHGITEKNFTDFDATTQTGRLIVKTFDKNEVAASRLLLKTGLESIFTSQRKLFKRYDFQDLQNYMAGVSNTDWPFLTTDLELTKFNSVPIQYDKYLLNKIRCKLIYSEVNETTLLFKFKYGGIPMVINLLNRNLNWLPAYLEKGAMLYPEHFVKKVEKLRKQSNVTEIQAE